MLKDRRVPVAGARPPGLVVAGTHSGCGKTTVALALMASLERRGVRVAPFKVGPDFIDPGHHRSICRRPSHNLDTWMLSRKTCRRLFEHGLHGADMAVVEGVMGLFDGASGSGEAGSTAEVAKLLGLPVLLVVDARSMARSIAALVKGYLEYDPGLRFCGIVVNRVGSHRHRRLLQQALSPPPVPWLAFLHRDRSIELPSRHLGLVTPEDRSMDQEAVEKLADWLERDAEPSGLVRRLARGGTGLGRCKAQGRPSSPVRLCLEGRPRRPVRIAVARDRAFCFYYQANLEILQELGAELAFFSPLDDASLPAGTSGLYLGGGYPELYARELASNKALMEEIRHSSLMDMPIYAECGGFMYLCKGIREGEGGQGRFRRWVGVFPFELKMEGHFKALGYRHVRIESDCPVGRAGFHVKGHEFHYSSMCGEPPGPVKRVYAVSDARGEALGKEGYLVRKTLGSYVHLHFGSQPEAAGWFLEECRGFAGRARGDTPRVSGGKGH